MAKGKLANLTRKKEFYLGMLLSIFLLIVVFVINVFITYVDNQKEIMKKIDIVTDTVEGNVTRTLKTIDNVSKNVFLSEDFQNKVDGLFDENTYDISIEGINKMFDKNLNSSDSMLIKDICYIPRNKNGELDVDKFIHSGYSSNLFNNKTDANLDKIISESLLTENLQGALFLNELYYFGTVSDQICFARNILSLRNHNYNEKMGIGIVVINKQRLIELLDYSNVIDGFGIALNYNDKISFYSDNYKGYSGAEQDILKTISLSFYNCKIKTYFDANYFLISLQPTFLNLVLIMIGVVIFYICFYFLFHRKNLKSLYYMFDNFHQIKKDVQLRPIDYINDAEVNRVILAYNEMVESVNALNASVLQEKDIALKYQLQKNNFEIRSLYAQINKHFIINVLSIIHSLININQIKNANYCLENLSDFLRYSLTMESNSNIKDELYNIQSYFNIQSIRYSKVNYQIDYDGSIDDFKVPKLIIQPLIENAYMHGLKNKNGSINVIVKKENDKIHILVIDNGNGLSEENLQLINEKITLCEEIESQSEVSHGIALTNIQKRLNLMYHDKAKLKIDVIDGKTVSSIVIETE